MEMSCSQIYAAVVQWIERQIPVLNVGGSSPFGRTMPSVLTAFEKLVASQMPNTQKLTMA